jgi:hypothetical protein
MNYDELWPLDIFIAGLGLKTMFWFCFITDHANTFTEVDIEMRWPLVLISFSSWHQSSKLNGIASY